MARSTGTQSLSTTPVQLPSQPTKAAVLTNNDAAIAVLLGWNSSTQNFTLRPSTSIRIECSNLNQLYAKSASGTPTLSYLTE